MLERAVSGMAIKIRKPGKEVTTGGAGCKKERLDPVLANEVQAEPQSGNSVRFAVKLVGNFLQASSVAFKKSFSTCNC